MITPQNFDGFSNPFQNISKLKKGEKQRVRTIKIQDFSLKSEKVLYSCDWATLISPNDGLKDCACFKFISNDTNSDQIVIDGQYFGVPNNLKDFFEFYSEIDGERINFNTIDDLNLQDLSFFGDAFISPIDSVSITKSGDVYQTIYNVYCVFEGVSYHIMQFVFYSDDSKFYKQNGFKSKISIYGQFWRLKAISNGKLNELYFIHCLLGYGDTSINFIHYLKDFYYSRFDFRFDFFVDKKVKSLTFQDVFPLSKVVKGGSEFIQKHYTGETFTGRNTTNRKSKYVYTRMYQKQIDAITKGEKDLYYDYCTYHGNVWRLEFEFGSKFTNSRGRISFIDECINHTLTYQVFEYIGIDETTGPYSRSYSIDIPYDSNSTFQKRRMLSQLGGMCDKLNKAGINCFDAIQAVLKNKKGYSDYDLKALRDDDSNLNKVIKGLLNSNT